MLVVRCEFGTNQDVRLMVVRAPRHGPWRCMRALYGTLFSDSGSDGFNWLFRLELAHILGLLSDVPPDVYVSLEQVGS
jgi:hypothetical protein